MSVLSDNVGDVARHDFDVLGLETLTQTTGENVLAVLSTLVYNRYNLQFLNVGNSTSDWSGSTRSDGQIEVPSTVWLSVMREVGMHYSGGLGRNVYHNSTHAADVMQTTCCIANQPRFNELFTQVDLLVLAVAAAVHDYKHLGVTNRFIVHSEHSLADVYSDDSVLERHHLASFFKLTRQDKWNIFINFSNVGRRLLRGMIIRTVLATDLAQSYRTSQTINEAIRHFDKGRRTSFNKHEVAKTPALHFMKMGILLLVLTCADVSHPLKALPVHFVWSQRVSLEFERQATREIAAGLPVSELCNVRALNVPQSQIDFMQYVIGGKLDALERFIGKGNDTMVYYRSNYELNRVYWGDQASICTLGQFPDKATVDAR